MRQKKGDIILIVPQHRMIFQPEHVVMIRERIKTRTTRHLLPDWYTSAYNIDGKFYWQYSPIGSVVFDGKLKNEHQPKYKPGDIIACTESFYLHKDWDIYSPALSITLSLNLKRKFPEIYYEDTKHLCPRLGRKRSPMHMPIAFSRAHIEIKEVEAIHLGKISEEYCIQEGGYTPETFKQVLEKLYPKENLNRFAYNYLFDLYWKKEL